jgi:hypothetical protein
MGDASFMTEAFSEELSDMPTCRAKSLPVNEKY